MFSYYVYAACRTHLIIVFSVKHFQILILKALIVFFYTILRKPAKVNKNYKAY